MFWSTFDVETSGRSFMGNGKGNADRGTGGAADPCGEDSTQPIRERLKKTVAV
ncbi:MAG: hypothetical protein ABR903_03790 [Thermodesulfovibrionales bacterium]